MNDYIDRKAAIHAVNSVLVNHIPTLLPRYEGIPLECAQAIMKIPSAQTEIIRCKDCRWGREACGNIECSVEGNVPPEYHGYEWFCPHGERSEE